MTTSEPNTPRLPDPAPTPGRDRDWLLLCLFLGGATLAGIAYVLHQHPAVRETMTAVGGVGSLLLLALQTVRGRL